MPTIRADYNGELFTSDTIREYKGFLREDMAQRLESSPRDISVFSTPYQHGEDSEFAAEVVAQISCKMAESEYTLDKSGLIVVSGLSMVLYSLRLATDQFCEQNNINEDIFLGVQAMQWAMKISKARNPRLLQ